MHRLISQCDPKVLFGCKMSLVFIGPPQDTSSLPDILPVLLFWHERSFLFVLERYFFFVLIAGCIATHKKTFTPNIGLALQLN